MSEGQLKIDEQVDAVLGAGVVLDGRTFRRPEATTFAHDWYVMSQVREAGLMTFAQRFDPLRDDLDGMTASIIVDAYESGKLFTILAGSLVEEGTVWSKERAETVAHFFASLTKNEDKMELRRILPWVLLNFFLNADASWRTFLKYSSVGQPVQPSGAGPSSGVPLTMESGTPSSERSQGGTSDSMTLSGTPGPFARG